MEKYHQDLTIRHDKEILSMFFEDLIVCLMNKGNFNFEILEKEKFINSWLERHYFHTHLSQAGQKKNWINDGL